MSSFKVGDRVRHVELIVKGAGTVVKVQKSKPYLGQTCIVRWDTLVQKGTHYGTYLRSEHE